jgi:hypothetical protein
MLLTTGHVGISDLCSLLCPTYSNDGVFLNKISDTVFTNNLGALVYCLLSLFLKYICWPFI